MHKKILSISALGAGMLMLLVSGTSLAGTTGKGCRSLEQKACDRASECLWVRGYRKSNGVKVSAYCRARPKKSGTPTSKKKASDSRKADNSRKTHAEKARKQP